MNGPLMLDLCCGAGLSAMGYHQAGFQIIGFDIAPQPRYPFTFIQADVLDLDLMALVAEYGASAIHGSFPCQHHTPLKAYQPDTIAERYDDLIDRMRPRLEATGLPYSIENVPGAPLNDPVELCGCMFPDLNVYRRRWFETNWGLEPVYHPPHVGARCARNGYLPTPERPLMTITGGKHSKAWQRKACEVMGVPWVAVPEDASVERTRIGIREVCEGIPPVYTEFVGLELVARLQRIEVAA